MTRSMLNNELKYELRKESIKSMFGRLWKENHRINVIERNISCESDNRIDSSEEKNQQRNTVCIEEPNGDVGKN